MQVQLRTAATSEVDSAIRYYRKEASAAVAIEFVEEFEKAISMLSQHPAAGSLRFAYELEIPDLRSWSLHKFPYIVFYLPQADHLDVWRILHARRDIPASLRVPPP